MCLERTQKEINDGVRRKRNQRVRPPNGQPDSKSVNLKSHTAHTHDEKDPDLIDRDDLQYDEERASKKASRDNSGVGGLTMTMAAEQETTRQQQRQQQMQAVEQLEARDPTKKDYPRYVGGYKNLIYVGYEKHDHGKKTDLDALEKLKKVDPIIYQDIFRCLGGNYFSSQSGSITYLTVEAAKVIAQHKNQFKSGITLEEKHLPEGFFLASTEGERHLPLKSEQKQYDNREFSRLVLDYKKPDQPKESHPLAIKLTPTPPPYKVEGTASQFMGMDDYRDSFIFLQWGYYSWENTFGRKSVDEVEAFKKEIYENIRHVSKDGNAILSKYEKQINLIAHRYHTFPMPALASGIPAQIEFYFKYIADKAQDRTTLFFKFMDAFAKEQDPKEGSKTIEELKNKYKDVFEILDNKQICQLWHVFLERGHYGVERLVSKFQEMLKIDNGNTLFNLLSTILDASPDWNEFLKADSKFSVFDKMIGLQESPGALAWWNTLSSQHVKTCGYSDLEDLFSAFEHFHNEFRKIGNFNFSQRSKENPADYPPNYEVELPIPFPLKFSKNMKVVMDRILILLRNAKNFKEQLNYLGELDFNNNDLIYTSDHQQYRLITAKMQPEYFKSPDHRLAMEANKEADVNAKVTFEEMVNLANKPDEVYQAWFYRYLGTQAYSANSKLYAQTIDELYAGKLLKFDNEKHIASKFLIVAVETTTNRRGYQCDVYENAKKFTELLKEKFKKANEYWYASTFYNEILTSLIQVITEARWISFDEIIIVANLNGSIKSDDRIFIKKLIVEQKTKFTEELKIYNKNKDAIDPKVYVACIKELHEKFNESPLLKTKLVRLLSIINLKDFRLELIYQLEGALNDFRDINGLDAYEELLDILSHLTIKDPKAPSPTFPQILLAIQGLGKIKKDDSTLNCFEQSIGKLNCEFKAKNYNPKKPKLIPMGELIKNFGVAVSAAGCGQLDEAKLNSVYDISYLLSLRNKQELDQKKDAKKSIIEPEVVCPVETNSAFDGFILLTDTKQPNKTEKTSEDVKQADAKTESSKAQKKVLTKAAAKQVPLEILEENQNELPDDDLEEITIPNDNLDVEHYEMIEENTLPTKAEVNEFGCKIDKNGKIINDALGEGLGDELKVTVFSETVDEFIVNFLTNKIEYAKTQISWGQYAKNIEVAPLDQKSDSLGDRKEDAKVAPAGLISSHAMKDTHSKSDSKTIDSKTITIDIKAEKPSGNSEAIQNDESDSEKNTPEEDLRVLNSLIDSKFKPVLSDDFKEKAYALKEYVNRVEQFILALNGIIKKWPTEFSDILSKVIAKDSIKPVPYFFQYLTEFLVEVSQTFSAKLTFPSEFLHLLMIHATNKKLNFNLLAVKQIFGAKNVSRTHKKLLFKFNLNAAVNNLNSFDFVNKLLEYHDSFSGIFDQLLYILRKNNTEYHRVSSATLKLLKLLSDINDENLTKKLFHLLSRHPDAYLAVVEELIKIEAPMEEKPVALCLKIEALKGEDSKTDLKKEAVITKDKKSEDVKSDVKLLESKDINAAVDFRPQIKEITKREMITRLIFQGCATDDFNEKTILAMIEDLSEETEETLNDLLKLRPPPTFETLVMVSKSPLPEDPELTKYAAFLRDSTNYKKYKYRDLDKQFDISSAISAVKQLENLNTKTPLSLKDKRKVFLQFSLINRFGMDPNFPIFIRNDTGEQLTAKDVTEEELKNLVVKCRSVFKDNESTLEEKENAKLVFIALIREAMWRITRKFPYSTQLMSVLLTANFNKNLLFQIDTGEGKGMIMAMIASLLWFEGKAVNVCTSNPELARVGFEEFAPVFDLLGIPRSKNVVTAQTPVTQYCYDGINYADTAQLSLFLANQKLDPYYLENHQHDEVSLAVDEADYMMLDDPTHFRYALKLHSVDINWVYRHIYLFSISKEFIEAKTIRAEIAALRKILLDQAKKIGPEMFDYIKKLPDRVINTWIESAIKVKHLKEGGIGKGGDYTIRTKWRGKGENRYPVSVACILCDGDPPKRIAHGAEWGNGVQQLLHVRENEKNNRRTRNKLPEFPIDPETAPRTSMSSRNVLGHHFERGRVIGVTGTAGDKDELKELKSQLGIHAYRIPPHKENKRTVEPPEVAIGQAEHFEKIFNAIIFQLRQPGPPPPILVTIPDIKKSYDFYWYLVEKLQEDKYTDCRHLVNTQLLNAMQSIVNGVPGNYSEEGIVSRAGVAGWVTISSLLDRGTDFKPRKKENDVNQNHPKGLYVIPTNADSYRLTRQIEGRCARNGHVGKTKLIIDGEEFKNIIVADPKKNPINLKNINNIVLLRSQRAAAAKKKRLFADRSAAIKDFFIKKYILLIQQPDYKKDHENKLVFKWMKLFDNMEILWSRYTSLKIKGDEDDLLRLCTKKMIDTTRKEWNRMLEIVPKYYEKFLIEEKDNSAIYDNVTFVPVEEKPEIDPDIGILFEEQDICAARHYVEHSPLRVTMREKISTSPIVNVKPKIPIQEDKKLSQPPLQPSSVQPVPLRIDLTLEMKTQAISLAASATVPSDAKLLLQTGVRIDSKDTKEIPSLIPLQRLHPGEDKKEVPTEVSADFKEKQNEIRERKAVSEYKEAIKKRLQSHFTVEIAMRNQRVKVAKECIQQVVDVKTTPEHTLEDVFNKFFQECFQLKSKIPYRKKILEIFSIIEWTKNTNFINTTKKTFLRVLNCFVTTVMKQYDQTRFSITTGGDAKKNESGTTKSKDALKFNCQEGEIVDSLRKLVMDKYDYAIAEEKAFEAKKSMMDTGRYLLSETGAVLEEGIALGYKYFWNQHYHYKDVLERLVQLLNHPFLFSDNELDKALAVAKHSREFMNSPFVLFQPISNLKEVKTVLDSLADRSALTDGVPLELLEGEFPDSGGDVKLDSKTPNKVGKPIDDVIINNPTSASPAPLQPEVHLSL